MEALETVKEFIKPELIILIPVCYFIGLALVNSKKVKNELTPLILGAIAIALSTLYVFATSDVAGYKTLLMALFIAITQGVLVAGCSVYVNQLLKQNAKAKQNTEV